MPKAAIDKLFETSNPKAHLHLRYDAETLADYQADLRVVVDLVKSGKREPSLASLRIHFLEEYGMQVTAATLRTHLNKLKAGETLWPESNKSSTTRKSARATSSNSKS